MKKIKEKFKIVKQKISLPIEQTSLEKPTSSKTHPRHSFLLPNNIRALIVGKSNSGKTNILINLLLHPNGLNYENIYLYSKSLHQEKYLNLMKIFSLIPDISFFYFNNAENMVTPEECKPNSIIIFDDILCDKANRQLLRQFFSRGRHKNLDTFYLHQTYANIDKHIVRDSANMVILFPQDELNLDKVYKDCFSTDFSFNTFKQMCHLCWKDSKYSFLVIDKESDLNNGRVRKQFDHFINIVTEEK